MKLVIRSCRIAAFVLLSFLATGVLGHLSAQTTGVVVGRVRDAASLRPLSDAQISIPGTGLGALSNAEGAFLIRNVPPGQVTVRAEILGYRALEQTINVLAGQTGNVEFALSQDAIALDELVVTGVGKQTERRRLATSLDVISAE